VNTNASPPQSSWVHPLGPPGSPNPQGYAPPQGPPPPDNRGWNNSSPYPPQGGYNSGPPPQNNWGPPGGGYGGGYGGPPQGGYQGEYQQESRGTFLALSFIAGSSLQFYRLVWGWTPSAAATTASCLCPNTSPTQVRSRDRHSDSSRYV
jgi:hypothetical protein